jgi:hypothetical protein
MEMPTQPTPQVADASDHPPVSMTALLLMVALVATPVWSVKLKAPTVTDPGAPVVTDQVLLAVAPTVTDAVVAVEGLTEEVSSMAIVLPLLTPVTGPATKAPPLIEMPLQAPPQVAVAPEKPPASVTVLLMVVEVTGTPVTLVKLKALTVPPPVPVVTVHALLVVAPTVTDADVRVEALAEEVCSMAMVVPLLTPVTGPGTNPPPLSDMPMQPALQVAVAPAKPPPSMTVLLMMEEPVATLVWFVKLKALTVPPLVPVVTCHAELVVGPTETEAVVGVEMLAEEVCWIAMVMPLLTPATGPAAKAPPLIEMPVQPARQVAV